MRYLTLVTLLCLDLFVFAKLEGHHIQWIFLALPVGFSVGLVAHFRSRQRAEKVSKENGMGHANAWMLTPAAFFVLKLFSNSVYTALSGDISKDTQAYFFLSGLFLFSLVFLGLAIGSSSLTGNKSSHGLVVGFFSILFTVSFLFFLFVLLLALDESWNNWRF